MRTIAITTALALAMGISGPAHAHHSPARFDIGAVVTLTGTLARYDFKNPHVYLYLQTADETGAAVTWELEASSTPNLVRRGWSADSLAVGDEISVEVNPPRLRNLRIARLQSVTKADGSVLAVRGDASVLEPADDTATASSLAGSWLGRYGLEQVGTNLASWPLTTKGRAAQASYDGTQNPHIDCVPVAAPLLMLYSNIYEISITPQLVTMKIEWMNVERVIHLDQNTHPDNGERSNQGYSIGHWEGETLVVDTRNFADNGAGNAFEIPSGAQKHLLEQFSLGADGKQIDYRFVLEDPEYLTEPVRGQGVWDYRPDLEALPNQCDPEIARRFLHSTP